MPDATRLWLALPLAAIALLSALGGCDVEATANPGRAVVPTPLALDAQQGSGEPHLAQSEAGELVLSWLEPAAGVGVTALRYAAYDATSSARAWSTAATVSEGANWFVNWADTPSVVPLADDLWAAHWLVKRPDNRYSYDVAIALSRDAGRSWSSPTVPHRDGTATEHGFVSLFPWRAGAGAIWLDGRQTTPGLGGRMTLRATTLYPDPAGGAPLAAPSIELDNQVCDCCQTDVAMLDSGPLAVFRNRTKAEMRDIAIAHFDATGTTSNSMVSRDGWRIKGCPVNGPAVAAQQQHVVSAWFTAAKQQPRVRVGWSTDGGKKFAAAHDVAVERVLGRVDVALLNDTSAAVSWLRSSADGAHGELCARRVDLAGTTGPVRVIATTGASRRAGVPQMQRLGDELIFAWTDSTGAATRVRAARLNVAAL